MFGHLRLHGLGRVVVAHQLHHVLLQLLLRVRVLLAQLLQDELLGEGPRHAESEKLLEDERLVLSCTHSPLVQVGSLGVLELRENTKHQIFIIQWKTQYKPSECIRVGSPEWSSRNLATLQ